MGFCHDLPLGKGVGFLEVILSCKEREGGNLSLLKLSADTSRAGCCSQAPGHVLALLRLTAGSDVWIELDPRVEGWETKRQELLLQLDEKVLLFYPVFPD